MRRVVVTGLGALTPIGNTLNGFWKAALAGESGAETITSFDTSLFKTKFACELKGFNPADFFDRKEVRKYDPFTQYALVASDEAITDAMLLSDKLNLDRVGVIWGSGNGGVQTFEEQLKGYHDGDGTPRFSPYFMPRILVDIAAGVISMKHGFRGVNYAPISACATSTTAIIDAFNYIRWNKADVVITGGSEAPIAPSTIGGFGSAKALSQRNEDPKTASRPFDVERDGFVMGEGAGALVLEAYEHAKARGAKIYAEIVGGGMAADAYHLTGTHPEGAGAVLGMRLALEEAEISPDAVGYVNMHATSTPQGDESELKAVKTVFGQRDDLILGGTKSMTGHLLGAAGAIETILSIMTVKENLIPPTINTTKVIEGFEEMFNYDYSKAIHKEVNYAMSNTFGFGGHIASIVVKKYEE